MPGPDTTLPRNKATLLLFLLKSLLWVGMAFAVGAQPLGHAQQAPSQPSEPQSSPAAHPPSTAGQQQPSNESGTYVLRRDVDEVLLHATVVDDKQHIITNLANSSFSVFEDGKPQTIISF